MEKGSRKLPDQSRISRITEKYDRFHLFLFRIGKFLPVKGASYPTGLHAFSFGKEQELLSIIPDFLLKVRKSRISLQKKEASYIFEKAVRLSEVGKGFAPVFHKLDIELTLRVFFENFRLQLLNKSFRKRFSRKTPLGLSLLHNFLHSCFSFVLYCQTHASPSSISILPS